MIITITKGEILEQLYLQLSSHFLLSVEEKQFIRTYFDEALERCEYNFKQSVNKYYYRIEKGERVAFFNPYHSVQYMTFLYYLSNTLYKKGCSSILCDKLYYLNKILNSVDLFYAIELPDYYHADHPVGSVMGRAQYGYGFQFLQGCTVGGSYGKDGTLYYPVIEENVRMFANSSIIGRCHIGNNTQIGAGALVKNQDVSANSIVFGQSPNLIIKQAQ